MKNDKEKAMQLLRDLGEAADKFVDEADTDTVTAQTFSKKKISWSTVALSACAAAVVLVIGLNLPEKSSGPAPASPVMTDTYNTEPVTETEAATESVSEETEPETQPAAPLTEVQIVTEFIPEVITSAESEPERTGEYSFSDDITGEGNAAYSNSDGSITITFRDGKFALTVPAEWENHFVIDGTVLYSKAAYKNQHGGKLISFGFSDEYSHISGISVLRGYSGGEYWNTFRVTDMQYNPENEEESSEYIMLRDELNSVLYYESRSDETGSLSSTFDIPGGINGEISSYEKVKLFAYTESYVTAQTPESESRNWEIENGWHITAGKGICMRGSGIYYYCNDTDDGDSYGWISAGIVNFYNENK